MSEQLDLFGTEPYKLHRKKDPTTSKESAHSVNSTKLEALVYEAIKSVGKKGVISSDLLEMFPNLPYSSITARFKALSEKNLIRFEGTRKGPSGRNQRVMFINGV